MTVLSSNDARQKIGLVSIHDGTNKLDLSGNGEIQTLDRKIQHAYNEILNTYGDTVLIKPKSLLKFGRRITAGTGWEPIMTTVGTETSETFATGNNIDTVVSTQSGDNGKTLNLEYHTVSGGVTTFGVQAVTLDATNATTPVSLTTPVFRSNRAYNTSSTALTGTIYFYENNSGRDDNKTHLVIPAGEQQTQKASTTISGADYLIITNFSISVLSKVTKYAEARLEIKPVATPYWRPISQTVSVTDTTGTVNLEVEPCIIVPSNYDIRIAVKTNTASVDVSGGFNGYLALVQ